MTSRANVPPFPVRRGGRDPGRRLEGAGSASRSAVCPPRSFVEEWRRRPPARPRLPVGSRVAGRRLAVPGAGRQEENGGEESSFPGPSWQKSDLTALRNSGGGQTGRGPCPGGSYPLRGVRLAFLSPRLPLWTESIRPA